MARRRYQTGRIYIRGKRCPRYIGRWREDVIQADGSIRRVERYTVLGKVAEVTEKQAKQAFKPILDEVNDSAGQPAKFTTFGKFISEWKAQVLVHQKPSNIKATESHLKTYIRWLGEVRLEEFTCKEQQKFVTRLSKRLSRKSIVNVLGTLSSMLKKAKAWKYRCQAIMWDDLELPAKQVDARRRSFTGDEAKRIIEFASEPYRTMFAIAAMSGLRVGEIVALQRGDLDFERRLIHVRRSAWYGRVQTLKSKASQAPVAMPEALATLLIDYLATWQPNPEGFLFLNRNGRPYAGNKVVEYGLWPVLDELGLARGGMHAFRHCHTSLLLDVGAPVTVAKEQLRHSDARTTLEIYGHVVGDAQHSAVNKVGEILRPNAPKSEKPSEWIQ